MKKNSEDYIQVYLVSFLRKCGVFTAAIPNGGRRNKAEAAKLKLMGVTAGVQDLFLISNNKFGFLELKVKETGKLSKEQKDVMKIMEDNQIQHWVIYATDPADAIAQAGIILLEYFGVDYQLISESSTKVISGLP